MKNNVDDTIMPFIDGQPRPCLLLPRTIMTKELWQLIITLYIETHNASMISRIITQKWHIQISNLFHMVSR